MWLLAKSQHHGRCGSCLIARCAGRPGRAPRGPLPLGEAVSATQRPKRYAADDRAKRQRRDAARELVGPHERLGDRGPQLLGHLGLELQPREGLGEARVVVDRDAVLARPARGCARRPRRAGRDDPRRAAPTRCRSSARRRAYAWASSTLLRAMTATGARQRAAPARRAAARRRVGRRALGDVDGRARARTAGCRGARASRES